MKTIPCHARADYRQHIVSGLFKDTFVFAWFKI